MANYSTDPQKEWNEKHTRLNSKSRVNSCVYTDSTILEDLGQDRCFVQSFQMLIVLGGL